MGRKINVWIFLENNCQNLTWENQQKGNLKRETESHKIAAQTRIYPGEWDIKFSGIFRY